MVNEPSVRAIAVRLWLFFFFVFFLLICNVFVVHPCLFTLPAGIIGGCFLLLWLFLDTLFYYFFLKSNYLLPFTHLYRVDSSILTLWTGLFPIKGVSS